ncbi:MAG TPA: hypothetical protein VL595_18495 [Pseudonocardia sp.]|nr:hypothetical protein [Pseudonocardia sp.]
MFCRRQLTAIAVGAALVTSAVGCGTKAAAPQPSPPGAPAVSAPPAAPTSTPFAAAGPLIEKPDFAKQLENFEAARFSDPTRVTNTWFPLVPGMQSTYDGNSVEDGETHKKHFVQTVTDLTKTIMGVRTVVVWSQGYDDGELKDAQLSFYGQADGGDLWYFGEYPEEYENGKVVSTLTWIAGIAGARPGIAMKQVAEIGSPSYSEGFSPVVPWTDRARTSQVGVKDCVPQGCHENMIVTDEFNREEPGATQQKFYAPGVGNARTASGTGDAKESLELTKLVRLDPAELDAARAEALRLDASGTQHSREAYALSAPIERPPGR